MGEWEASTTVAAALLLVVTSVVGGIPIGAAAGASSGSTDASRKIVYGQDSSREVHTYWSNSSTTSFGVDAVAIGPVAELDGDGEMEVPFVKSDDLRVVEADGDVTTLVVGGVGDYSLAIGDWDGDDHPSVFYSDGKYLTRYEPATGETEEFGIKSKGTGGVGDVDGDGSLEVVYQGSSGQLRYLNKDGTEVTTKWYAYGIGTPHDFDGDGTPSVPVVDGSNNVKLVSVAEDSATDLGANSKKTSIGLANVTGDSTAEVLYLDTKDSPAEAKYVTLSGETAYLHDATDARIEISKDVGIAGILTVAPVISDYDVSNPTGRELHVEFNSTEKLTDLTVEVEGPSDHDFNLTEGDFTNTTLADGSYHYTATTTVSTDGNYTATLTVAEDADGANGASGQDETVEIQTPYPNVTDVTLTDQTDDDGYVAGGHTVRITATVDHESDLTSVTADAAAFGAGTVTLSHASGDTYEGTFTVDASDVPADGSADVAVTATNEYDHRDTNDSGSVYVDTTPPNPDAGPDRTIEEGTEITLDGDGSTDNTRIVEYTWTFDNGTNVTDISVTRTYSDPGTYTPELAVTDTVGHTATGAVTVTVENVTSSEVNFTITDTSLTDASDNDGYVADGDEVRVTATVDSEYAIKEVRADASAFGAGTVTLSKTSGNQYAATFTVDASDASDDGQTAVQVTAVDEYDHVATATTETVFLDTTAPTADAGANLTIEEDTRVVFDGVGSSDNAKISRYVWTFEDGTTATGATPTHTYENPGTYTVELRVLDPVGHAATDTVTVDVTDVAETTTTTEVVYAESDDDNETATETETNTTVTRNRTVTNGTDGTTVVSVRNVNANASVRFDLPAENHTAADLRTVTVVTDHDGDARLWATPSASAPANVAALDADRAVDPVGYWNLTIHNARSATLAFGVNGSRLGAAGPDAVSLYRLVDGAWERIDAQHVRTADGEVRFVARVSDLSGTGIFGVGVRRGSLRVTHLRPGNRRTIAGRRVVLRATVTNDGARTVTETLELTVDGTVVAEQTVTVPADGTRNATFTFVPSSSGDYALSVGSEEVALSATQPTRQVQDARGASDEPARNSEQPERPPLRALAALSMAAVGIAYELAMAGGLESLFG